MIGRVDHGEGWVGGEAVFIPAKPGVSAEGSEEDDGFLATFVSPRNGGTSGTLDIWCLYSVVATYALFWEVCSMLASGLFFGW